MSTTYDQTAVPAGIADSYCAGDFQPCNKPAQSLSAAKKAAAAQWMSTVCATDAFTSKRADWRENASTVLAHLAKSAYGPGLTTRITWDKLSEASNLSRRTIARVLAWLRTHRWLHVRSTGAAAEWSASGKNESADYQLIREGAEIPVITAEVAPPLTTTTKAIDIPIAREETSVHGATRRVFSRKKDQREPAIAVDEVVSSKRQALGWVATLREHAPELGSVSSRRLRWLLKDLWKGGWTVLDALAALSEGPDGGFWSSRGGYVRDEVSWTLGRLKLWEQSGRKPDERQRCAAFLAMQDRQWQTAKQQTKDAQPVVSTYADAGQVVVAHHLEAGRVQVRRHEALVPWDRVLVGVERAAGVREVVGELTNTRSEVVLPTTGQLFVMVLHINGRSAALPVTIQPKKAARERAAVGNLGWLSALFNSPAVAGQ